MVRTSRRPSLSLLRMRDRSAVGPMAVVRGQRGGDDLAAMRLFAACERGEGRPFGQAKRRKDGDGPRVLPLLVFL